MLPQPAPLLFCPCGSAVLTSVTAITRDAPWSGVSLGSMCQGRHEVAVVVARPPCCLRLSRAPMSAETTFCLPTYHVMDIWATVKDAALNILVHVFM